MTGAKPTAGGVGAVATVGVRERRPEAPVVQSATHLVVPVGPQQGLSRDRLRHLV